MIYCLLDAVTGEILWEGTSFDSLCDWLTENPQPNSVTVETV